MKILMIDTIATMHGSFRQGQTYDVDLAKAKKFIERGLAIKVEETDMPAKRRTTSLKHGDKG